MVGDLVDNVILTLGVPLCKNMTRSKMMQTQFTVKLYCSHLAPVNRINNSSVSLFVCLLFVSLFLCFFQIASLMAQLETVSYSAHSFMQPSQTCICPDSLPVFPHKDMFMNVTTILGARKGIEHNQQTEALFSVLTYWIRRLWADIKT